MVVDDEPLAQNLIEKFINRVPYLVLSATYDNAIEAMHRVDDVQPDIIFLDVNMPEMTGIEFLKSFVGDRPDVIFTTAHQQYAYEGFEHNVVDYLLKPIAFDRFMKAVHKVEKRLHFDPEKTSNELTAAEAIPQAENILSSTDSFSETSFLVKVDKKLVQIAYSEIVYVEGMKDYIKIHLADRFFITHMTMTRMMSLLSSQFIRINRSYIVQTMHIKYIEGNMMMMSNGDRLTIGVNYRTMIKEAMDKWTL